MPDKTFARHFIIISDKHKTCKTSKNRKKIQFMKNSSQTLNKKSPITNHNIDEIVRIGYFDIFEIIVYTDDPDNIPHVHVIDKETHGEKFNICVKLEIAEYFIHSKKSNNKFNSIQREGFDNFMSEKPSNKRYNSNYEYACSMWNDNNSQQYINETLEKPDYTKLK